MLGSKLGPPIFGNYHVGTRKNRFWCKISDRCDIGGGREPRDTVSVSYQIEGQAFGRGPIVFEALA